MRSTRLASLVALLLGALWIAPNAAPQPARRVAILYSANVDVYKQAVRGFKESVEYEVVGEYDMRGDFDRGRRLLAEIRQEKSPDLLLAVGVWALDVAVEASLDIPVVYTMVLNPPAVVGDRTRNVTGASMNVPVQKALRVLHELGPEIRRVGVLFDPVHTGYLVERARSLAPDEDLELVARPVRSSGEAVAALDALQQEGIDALWIVPDKTILAPAVVEHMLLFSYRNGVPLLGLSRRQADMGALLTLSFASSEDIGRQAGELANRALSGSSPGSIPFTMARQVDLTVNLKTAKRIGIRIPERVLADAKDVIR